MTLQKLMSMALVLWSLSTASAWGAPAHGEGEHHSHDHHSDLVHTPLPMATPVAEGSLHQLDVVWQTHRGETMTLADTGGGPVIVTMLYARCTTACPMLVQDVKRIHQALPDTTREQTTLLLVSFDTDRDTPEALNHYARSVGADDDAWHFATGSPAEVRTLAALLGVRYRKNPDGGYDHSNVIAILNAKGELVHRQEGLNQPVTAAVNALE